jgi:DNA-binding NarL/FixJ family response regulator
VIRTVILDDHAAVRAGLAVLIRREPGFLLAAAAADADADELGMALGAEPADLAIVDYHLPRGDGIEVGRQLKRDKRCRHVVIYSAFASDRLAAAAAVAGLDGTIGKGTPGPELFAQLREIVRIGPQRVSPETLRDVGDEIDPGELAILSLAALRTPAEEIATTLRISHADVSARLERMLAALKPRLL